jgi:hypothetical protein
VFAALGLLPKPVFHDAYGEPRVYAGSTTTSILGAGNLLSVSAVGNPLMHQGLRREPAHCVICRWHPQ